LDHSLRAGDSLVGLTRKQIAAFDWNPSTQMSLLEQRVRQKIDTVSNYRQQIFAARDDVPYALLKQKLDAAEDALNLPRQIGDAVIAAFFDAEKAKDRENIRMQLSDQITNDLRDHGFITLNGPADKAIAKLKTGARKIHPFHWELEFPEVFGLSEHGDQTGGFDAIVGNPPFLGGTRISTVAGMTYFSWITSRFEGCGHLCDLVAYFFRRAFGLLRPSGAFGLIATNTISQGDTREGGLRRILSDGGTIYAATRRFKWPSAVAVVVSVVHVVKQRGSISCILDGKKVSRISAYLSEGENDESPARLLTNPYFSLGSKIYGQGFVFADDDPECTPLSVFARRNWMRGLIYEKLFERK
ncbi:MAG: DNA methyltransferase, partial [Candidatus Korobacteraceae bacterium]